jgi:hypothetical protein
MPMNPRLLRPTASGFDPRRIAGLALWLDGLNSSSITLNSTTVSQWRDLSGNNRHCGHPTAARQPTRIAKGISLDGTQSLYGNAGWTADAFTLFVAADINAAGSGTFARIFTQRFAAGVADFQTTVLIPLQKHSSTGTNFGVASASFAAPSVVATSNPRPCVYVVTKATGASGQKTVRVNGGTPATGTAGSTTGATAAREYAIGMELNSSGVTNSSGGSVGEVYGVAAYSRLLSEAEITALTRAFGGRYGINVL